MTYQNITNPKKISQVLSLLLSVLASGPLLSLTGCSLEAEGVASDQIVSSQIGFDEFVAGVYQEPDTGIYIVDGDTPIETFEQLKEFYHRINRGQALTVHQSGGTDVAWSASQKNSLFYCVSTGFGSNYNTVVNAMNEAATDWGAAANISFIHLSQHDSNCTASNNSVVFDVRLTSGQPYLARAFFPNFSRASRNILIDSNSFGVLGRWTLTGILRHELGHALGFRHEHTRPEAGTCFEDYSWRPLTSYDSSSVMHYPQCNGSNIDDLVLTERDKDGAATLYGPRWDPNRWYRLTNMFLGDGRSLDTYSDALNAPFMGNTGYYSGQYWRITPLGGGYYRLTNMFLGDGRSLDTYSGALNAPFMGNTGYYSGQYWRITPLGGGYYRLTNMFLGDGRSLDTYSGALNAPFMGNTGYYSGQYWRITPL